MNSRHFYKHKLTGIVAALNDEFAEMFGDAFSLVGDTDTPADNSTPEGTPVPSAETQDAKAADTTDSKKETK